MSIETSPKPATVKSSDASEARGRKPTGQTGTVPENGFTAILSAMDEAAVPIAEPLGDHSDEKVLLAPVDTAQAATNLIAIPGVIPVSVQPMQVSEVVGVPKAAIAIRTSTAPSKPVGPEVSLNTDLLRSQTIAPADDKSAGKVRVQPGVDQSASRAVPETSRIQESRFMATLEALRVVQERSSPEPALVLGPMSPVAGEKPTAERGRFQERMTDGALGAQPLSLGTTSYASPSVQDAGAVSPEMAVAQEVSYWISQDVQNAELKLDGLGLEAVEVSITVQGNEAHVAFRTDELQARSLLEGAAAHLKEALRGEGLVLSGVSVGTSGGRDSGDNERKQRQGGRQTATVPAPVQSTSAHRPQGGVAGRTLDLFV